MEKDRLRTRLPAGLRQLALQLPLRVMRQRDEEAMRREAEDAADTLVRAVKRSLSVYGVRLRRQTRLWAIEEAFQRRVGTAYVDAEDTLLRDPVSWRSAGTLAETAGSAWRHLAATAKSASARDALNQRGAVLKVFVRGGDQGVRDEALAAVMQQVDALTRWLPPTLTDGTLVLSWVVVCDAKEDFPWPAVFLSVALGRFSRRLRPCRYCGRPFVAGHPWVRTCGDCERFSRHVLRRADVRRILDRLRKRDNGAQLQQQARAVLRTMSLPNWKAKWDSRLGPQGRPLAKVTSRSGR